MDILAKQISCQTLQPKSGIGFKIAPRAERIPYLLFADDSLHFCKASSLAAFKLKHIIDTFCERSAQLVNFHKSNIAFSKNTCPTLISSMLREYSIHLRALRWDDILVVWFFRVGLRYNPSKTCSLKLPIH